MVQVLIFELYFRTWKTALCADVCVPQGKYAIKGFFSTVCGPVSLWQACPERTGAWATVKSMMASSCRGQPELHSEMLPVRVWGFSLLWQVGVLLLLPPALPCCIHVLGLGTFCLKVLSSCHYPFREPLTQPYEVLIKAVEFAVFLATDECCILLSCNILNLKSICTLNTLNT